MNIKQTLQNSIKILKLYNIPFATLDAEVLLLKVLNINRMEHKANSEAEQEISSSSFTAFQDDNNELRKSWLYAHDDYELKDEENILFNDYINRRIKHEPVSYITNKKEFFGYDFFVNKNVLIPRPETELIVEEVLKIINIEKNIYNRFNLVDVGTGSGCIAISILNELQNIKKNNFINKSIVIDISKKAIEVARINAKKYSLENQIEFINRDFKKEINQKLFSDSNDFIITANLPYVKNDDYHVLSNDVKDYEPKIALTSGIDGLDDIKNLLNSVSKIILQSNQNIYILLEADPSQIDCIIKDFDKYFKNKESKIIEDLSGKNRIVVVRIGF